MCCCFRLCTRKCCRCCDYLLVSGLVAGGVSTATTTVLHYQGIIHEWMWVVIPSGVTIASILGLIIRGLCKSGLVNKNNNKQVINIIRRDRDDVLEAQPIELKSASPLLIKNKKVKKIQVVPVVNKEKKQKYEEYRIDITDGNPYTKQEFIDFYGGTEEWDQSVAKRNFI